MKKIVFTLTLLAVMVAGAITYKALDRKMYPVIKNFGVVYDVPFAVEKPDTTMPYKIIVDMCEKNAKPEELYPPLEHIARMYNVHVYGGVKQENLDVAIAVWGEPITVVLNNEAYKKKIMRRIKRNMALIIPT
jgi:hypothetical protein